MPEIGEVARIVNRLRQHLVGRTISKVHAIPDEVVFKDTTHLDFMKKLEGKKVVAAQQWGKYFWLVMESPPHPVLHFGMTGWIEIKNDPAAHYRQTIIETEWPPKFQKFSLKIKEDDNEFAFVDKRRLGRVRLVNVDAKDIRTTEPIAANGPDPVQEQIEKTWLYEKLNKKKLSVKAFLLDQAILSGIGNWVADEILFNSRIHPETLTYTLSEDQMAALFKSINYVTKTTVETDAELEKLPQDWLMAYRWDKRNNGLILPSGHKIEFLKVGGRTSAFVPALQMKGVKDIGEIGAKPEKEASRKRSAREDGEDEEYDDEKKSGEKATKDIVRKQVGRPRGRRKKETTIEPGDEGSLEKANLTVLKRRRVKTQVDGRGYNC